MKDNDDVTNLSTSASLVIIGCAGLALGLLLYFAARFIDGG
jgi:uncharacterized membrane protein YhiD involved in acid resistance